MNVLIQEYGNRAAWCAFDVSDPRKKPINPHTGGLASINDRSTFGTYAQARERAEGMRNGGVGFATWGAPELCFLDLDGALDPITEEPREWAQKLLDETGDTFTYVTPSGTGLRIVARDPGGSVQRSVRMAEKAEGEKQQQVEVFQDTNRYVTVTDVIWAGRDRIEPVPGIRERVLAKATDAVVPSKFEWGHDTGAEFEAEDLYNDRSKSFGRAIFTMLRQRMTPADCLRIMSETPWAEEKYRGRMEQEVGRLVGKFKTLNDGLPCEEVAADDFPDDIAPDPAEAPKKRGTGFLSFDELMAMKDPAWLVKGMIPVGSYGSIVGHSQSFKSFFAIGVGMSLATGRAPFVGHEPDVAVPTQFLMIAGEGADTLKARVRAWRDSQKVEIEDPAIMVQPEPSTLNDERVVKNLIQRIKTIRHPGHRLFIVVDTLSQNFIGDENSSEEVGKFVDNIRRMSRELRAHIPDVGEENATVVFVHHLGKDASKGARGSSLLLANVDFQITLKRETDRLETEVIVTKQKAAATGSLGKVEMLRHFLPGQEDTLEEALVCGAELRPTGRREKKAPDSSLLRQEWLIENVRDGVEAQTLEEGLVAEFGVSKKTAQRDFNELLRNFKELKTEPGADNRRIVRGEIAPEEA